MRIQWMKKNEKYPDEGMQETSVVQMSQGDQIFHMYITRIYSWLESLVYIMTS